MRQRKRYFASLSMTIWAGLLLAGCDPEPVPVQSEVESTGQATVTFTFGVQEYEETGTKSVAADIADDEVDRIDIFSYDAEGKALQHKVIGGGSTALDLSSVSFIDAGPNGEIRRYLVMANLDQDSAEYIATLEQGKLCSYPEGFIPWSAGNCRPGRPLMGATVRIGFSSGATNSTSVTLMRYMSKFEIGTVTAEFWGTPDQFRNVYLNHIVFSNSWDLVRICQTNPAYFTGDPQEIFGTKGWTTGGKFGNPSGYIYYQANEFMGQDDWGRYGLTYAVMDGTYNQGNYGGRGLLDQDYKYLYNNNYMQAKNSINLDAPESLKTVSQQSWDTNAYLDVNNGRLCHEYEGSTGPFAVNKVFYSLPTYFTVTYSDPAYDVSGQDRAHKLVIAVKINGKNYYYPIRLLHLQPNMLYRIKNITLKGEPTEYPNVWLRGNVVSRSMAATKAEITGQAGNDGSAGHDVNQWKVHGNVAEIEDLVLYGADTYSEEEGL